MIHLRQGVKGLDVTWHSKGKGNRFKVAHIRRKNHLSVIYRAYFQELCLVTGLSAHNIGYQLGYGENHLFSKWVRGKLSVDKYMNTYESFGVALRASVKFGFPFDLSRYVHLLPSKFELDELDFRADVMQAQDLNSPANRAKLKAKKKKK